MRLVLLVFFLLTGIIAVFYFSWLPQPDFRTVSFIPGWLARWSNTHDTLRTAVPFIFLGFFSGLALVDLNKPRIWWLFTWFAFVLIAIIAETGQLFLALRVFDWRDIVWGCAGALCGLLVASLFHRFFSI
jgi:glycopeptide antibiotics resistance protein